MGGRHGEVIERSAREAWEARGRSWEVVGGRRRRPSNVRAPLPRSRAHVHVELDALDGELVLGGLPLQRGLQRHEARLRRKAMHALSRRP